MRFKDGVLVHYHGNHLSAGYYNEDGYLIGVTILSPAGWIDLYFIPQKYEELRSERFSNMEEIRDFLTEEEVATYSDHPEIRLVRDFALYESGNPMWN